MYGMSLSNMLVSVEAHRSTTKVFVVATPELCKEWNESRPEEGRYAPET
jgi:hypothetical protein